MFSTSFFFFTFFFTFNKAIKYITLFAKHGLFCFLFPELFGGSGKHNKNILHNLCRSLELYFPQNLPHNCKTSPKFAQKLAKNWPKTCPKKSVKDFVLQSVKNFYCNCQSKNLSVQKISQIRPSKNLSVMKRGYPLGPSPPPWWSLPTWRSGKKSSCGEACHTHLVC